MRWVFLLLLFSFSVSAGQVRHLYTNDKTIPTIYLSMGQSTILRFKERPKKTVLGNANYIRIEFIDNDLALQPLNAITTNLFVYGEFGRTYGFQLKVGNESSHDDLVYIKWKYKRPPPKKKLQPKKRLKKKLLFEKLLITVESVSTHKGLNLVLVDLSVKNVSPASLSLKALKVEIIQKKKSLFPQFVLVSETLKKGEWTSGRVILRSDKKGPFTLKANFHEKSKQTLIFRRNK